MRCFRGWVLLSASALLASCSSTHECTAIGCVDGWYITLSPDDGAWPQGDYDLLVIRDGVSLSCAFSIPADLPASGTLTSKACGDDIQLTIEQRADCHEVHQGSSASQVCDQIADQYDLRLSASGQPQALGVTLNRGGAKQLSDVRELQYESSRPNGPDCEPVCHQAHVELSFTPT